MFFIHRMGVYKILLSPLHCIADDYYKVRFCASWTGLVWTHSFHLATWQQTSYGIAPVVFPQCTRAMFRSIIWYPKTLNDRFGCRIPALFSGFFRSGTHYWVTHLMVPLLVPSFPVPLPLLVWSVPVPLVCESTVENIYLRCESTVENTNTFEMWIDGGEHMHPWNVNQRWRTHTHLRCELTVENTCNLEMWINGGEHTHAWEVNWRWRTHASLRCESTVENTPTLEMWINGGEHTHTWDVNQWWRTHTWDVNRRWRIHDWDGNLWAG